MMDFGMMFKLKGMWDRFCKNHPMFPKFIKSFQKNGVNVDDIIDIKITYANGTDIETNIKVTQSDLELFEQLKQLKK